MEQIATQYDITSTNRHERESADGVWLCGSTPVMSRLGEDIRRAAQSDYPVLITGESGTGKTTAAEIIHRRSERANASFVDINCATLPEHLIESELFGFEKGAFTGATYLKKGLFEIANRGTLFLDEIGELRPELQAKLLKAIDERKIRRLGAIQQIYCDVRLIAASSRNLQRMVALQTFRADLYYRLAVLELDIPPLRDRREDIGELVHNYLAREQKNCGRVTHLQIDDAAMRELCLYSWPGNIRQLQNVLARFACFKNSAICVADVRTELDRFKHLEVDTINLPESCSTLFAGESLTQFSCRIRLAAIETVKNRTKGNMQRAAHRLKVDRASLVRTAQRMERRLRSRTNDSRSLWLTNQLSSDQVS